VVSAFVTVHNFFRKCSFFQNNSLQNRIFNLFLPEKQGVQAKNLPVIAVLEEFSSETAFKIFRFCSFWNIFW
jgi:hypothetical protein